MSHQDFPASHSLTISPGQAATNCGVIAWMSSSGPPRRESRDYLRSHVDARDAYAKVKQEAAQVWSDDRIAYTEAKTGVALDLLDAAEIWAMANSWAVIHPPG